MQIFLATYEYVNAYDVPAFHHYSHYGSVDKQKLRGGMNLSLMELLLIILLLFSFTGFGHSLPFQAITFDETSATFSYDIDPKYEQQIPTLCNGYDPKAGNRWESIIEDKPRTVLFQCCDPSVDCQEEGWKTKLLSNYIKAFERNRPRNWYDALEDTFDCKDVYNRSIPMPLGVRRCHVLHSSTLEQDQGKPIYTNIKDFGSSKSSSFGITGYYCRDSVAWNPSIPSDDPKALEDQQCAVKISLTSMHFFCCCYSDGKPCEVGIIAAEGLTCPQISMEASLTVKEGSDFSYSEAPTTADDEQVIDIEQLKLRDHCHTKIAVRRPKAAPKLETQIYLVEEDDAECAPMFDKLKKGETCNHLERQCFTDIDDTLVYCCKFEYKAFEEVIRQKEEDLANLALTAPGSIDRVLSIHSKFGKFIYNELKAFLSAFARCLRPPDGEAGFCIYFYDKILDRFLNVQIGTNFLLEKKVQAELEDFIAKEQAPGSKDHIFIHGNITLDDPRVYECAGSEGLQNIPHWYFITVVMFKCTTAPDSERCDDFITNPELLVEAQQIERAHICNIEQLPNGTYKYEKSWDRYCFEGVRYNAGEISDYTLELSAADREQNDKRPEDKWDSENAGKDGQFFCFTDDNERFCACVSDNPKEACNKGTFVQNMHIIENSPAVQLSNVPSKCLIPRVNQNDRRYTCVNQPEIGYSQTCVLGKHHNEIGDIGCIREPNLSHGKYHKRMQNFDWHVYQICKEVFDSTQENYRCLIQDNLFDEYSQAGIICCCKPEHCEEAYKKAARLKSKKLHDFFIQPVS